jgi:uncharacterized cupin superfamily protein
MTDPNVFTAAFARADEEPNGYRAAEADLGLLGHGYDLNVRLYEVPAGQSLCPYHYEYEEEWLLLLSGTLHLRASTGERELPAGALVRFAAGPQGAHKVTNRGDGPARLLMFGSAREPAVSVYPDSDKIGVWPPNRADRLMVRRSDGDRDYYDGELPA